MPNPTPVLLMVRALGIGGTERQLTETARFLDRDRFEPHVACLNPAGIRRSELDAAGIPILALPVPSFKKPAVIREAMMLGRYIREHKIQIAHTFDVPMNVFGVPAARFAPTPVVLSSQRAHRDLSSTGFRWILRGTDRIVDGVVVNCDAMRRHLVEDEGVRQERIHVCYNGIDTDAYYPAPAQRPPNLVGSLVVGVVCALRPEKGLETLLRGFATARKQFPGMKLLIVGSGPEEQRLKELASALAITESCHFEPATQNVAPWLRCIDIFVLPSLSEALSNSLMGAMACGCCPVASEVGGNPELVQPGRTGLLFKPGDEVALADRLCVLAADEKTRQRMGEASAKRIQSEFTHRAASARMAQIYETLLSDSHRSGRRRLS